MPPPPSERPPGTATPALADALRLIERHRPAIESELRAVLERRTVPPFTLMRYHLGWEDRHGRPIEGRGGKLLRPALCLLCCEAAGADPARALPAAVAVELVHNFTLIHDDVEDTSEHRHGRETLWSLWGVPQAINVGDGMFALAHATLLDLDRHAHAPERVLRASRMLDEATLRLCEGQHRDLIAEDATPISVPDYLDMIEGKTAALLAASCGIGALLAGAADAAVDALHEFGRRLGLAFQIRDDVLGIWGDPTETGKPAGDDLRAGKQSYPVVAGLERADAATRDRLRALLAADAPSDDDIARACALLERLGARDEAERAARSHAAAAVDGLRGVSLDDACRAQLELLAHFAAERAA